MLPTKVIPQAKAMLPTKVIRSTLLFFLLFFTTSVAFAQSPGEFESVRDALRDPAKVKVLDLSGQNEAVLDKRLAECVNMEELILDDMRLEAVPGFIKNLKKLKEISLSGNKLTKVPGWLGKLPQLESVDIRGNDIPDDGIDNFRRKFDEVDFLTD